MMPSPYREYAAETARDFLDYLRLTNPIWRNVERGWQHAWLFRGQKSATAPLVPSVWRTDETSYIMRILNAHIQNQKVESDKNFVRRHLALGSRYQGQEIPDFIVDNALDLFYRVYIEVVLVTRLLEQALLRGINIPDYVRTREFVNHYIGDQFLIVRQLADNKFDLLDQQFRSVIHNNSFWALAQHHGIPTRLLDWSTNPFIAAFFAAEGGLESQEGQLAVFAVHMGTLHSRGIINFPFPRSDNPYLHAQKGELTIYSGSSQYLMSGYYPTVEDRLNEHNDWNQEIQPIKITLGVDKAPELLRLLSAYEGVSRDQLMPTMDNIALVVKQQYLLDLSR